MRILIALLVVSLGFCVFMEHRKADAARQEGAAVKEQLEKATSDLTMRDQAINQSKVRLEQVSGELKTSQDAARKLAEAEAKIGEMTRQLAESQAGVNEGKQRGTELEAARAKVAALEGDLAKTKETLTASQSQVAQLQGEVQQLRAARRAPLPTGLDQKRNNP